MRRRTGDDGTKEDDFLRGRIITRFDETFNNNSSTTNVHVVSTVVYNYYWPSVFVAQISLRLKLDFFFFLFKISSLGVCVLH